MITRSVVVPRLLYCASNRALNVISDTCAFPDMLSQHCFALVNGSVDVTLAYPAVKTSFLCLLTRIARFQLAAL